MRKALDAWNGQSLHGLLLRLMAVNQDSNLVSRGGIEGLRYVQGYARELLANGWDCEALLKMDKALIERNRARAAADLLSVGWVLSAIK
ncbi:MAG: triphosphoribosyl-dephospho-CoA synthase [Enterobacter hormaechei]